MSQEEACRGRNGLRPRLISTANTVPASTARLVYDSEINKESSAFRVALLILELQK